MDGLCRDGVTHECSVMCTYNTSGVQVINYLLSSFLSLSSPSLPPSLFPIAELKEKPSSGPSTSSMPLCTPIQIFSPLSCPPTSPAYSNSSLARSAAPRNPQFDPPGGHRRPPNEPLVPPFAVRPPNRTAPSPSLSLSVDQGTRTQSSRTMTCSGSLPPALTPPTPAWPSWQRTTRNWRRVGS